MSSPRVPLRLLSLVLLLGTTSVLGRIDPRMLLRRDYLEAVCQPAPGPNPGDAVPPCTEIQVIETACQPNGTGPLYLKAHQECMCGGSYFPEWTACLACEALHGQRSPREVAFYGSVFSAASSAFCGVPTPTGRWQSVFATQEAEATPVTTGDTGSTDRAVSETAVSLYYTPSGSIGPGPITGSAAAATATTTATASTSSPAKTSQQQSSLGGASSGTASASPSSSTSAKPNVAGTVKSAAERVVLGVLLVGSVLLL